jgi:hypothetical protein
LRQRTFRWLSKGLKCRGEYYTELNGMPTSTKHRPGAAQIALDDEAQALAEGRSRRRPSLPALERASVAGTGQPWRHPCRGAVGGFQVGSAGFQTGQPIGEIIGRGGVSNRLGNQPAGDQINRGSTRIAGPRGKTLSDLLKPQSG